jgi:hypothetical protein
MRRIAPFLALAAVVPAASGATAADGPATNRTLTASLNGTPVVVVDHAFGTRTDGTTIFLDLAYARLVIRLAPSNPARTVAVDTFAKARAVYFLLHEYGHVVHWHERADGFEPERELRANQFAAQQFRAYCRERLALSDAALQQLWAALPPTWQRPSAVDMPRPS